MTSKNFRLDWLEDGSVSSVKINDDGEVIGIEFTCGIYISGTIKVHDPEFEKGLNALSRVPEKTRRYYKLHYKLSKAGCPFAGLVCSSCERWREAGHDDNCPVGHMENSDGV